MRFKVAFIIFTAALMAFHAAAAPKKDVTHGDGSSPVLAVDLSQARTEEEGMAAEKAWLNKHYPGARVESQALLSGPPVMDLIKITLPSGEKRSIYFDISSYFGKM